MNLVHFNLHNPGINTKFMTPKTYTPGVMNFALTPVIARRPMLLGGPISTNGAGLIAPAERHVAHAKIEISIYFSNFIVHGMNGAVVIWAVIKMKRILFINRGYSHIGIHFSRSDRSHIAILPGNREKVVAPALILLEWIEGLAFPEARTEEVMGKIIRSGSHYPRVDGPGAILALHLCKFRSRGSVKKLEYPGFTEFLDISHCRLFRRHAEDFPHALPPVLAASVKY